MKIIVADSSSLILLTKTDIIQTVVKHFEVYIPPSVYREVVQEIPDIRYPDAKGIKRLIEAKKITLEQNTKKQEFPVTLDSGEEDALSLFFQVKADAFLTDDGKAIKVCRYLNIPFINSTKLIVSLCKKGWIKKDIAIEALEVLREIGRYAPDIISRAFLELAEEE